MATLTRKSDRSVALAARARFTLDAWLDSGSRDDGLAAERAYDEMIEWSPTTVEGIAAVVSYLAYRQQVLLEDCEEPEIHSAFRSDVDAFCFIQALNDGIERMLQRQELSAMFSDPMVRDAFRRAESDDGEPEAASAASAPVLSGGAAERRPALELA